MVPVAKQLTLLLAVLIVIKVAAGTVIPKAKALNGLILPGQQFYSNDSNFCGSIVPKRNDSCSRSRTTDVSIQI